MASLYTNFDAEWDLFKSGLFILSFLDLSSYFSVTMRWHHSYYVPLWYLKSRMRQTQAMVYSLHPGGMVPLWEVSFQRLSQSFQKEGRTRLGLTLGTELTFHPPQGSITQVISPHPSPTSCRNLKSYLICQHLELLAAKPKSKRLKWRGISEGDAHLLETLAVLPLSSGVLWK